MTETFSLSEFPVHLGLGARVVPQPRMTGDMSWYESYGQRHADDGLEGRLVAMHTFSGPWDTWEMHPHGDELVCCVSGSMVLHQEIGGEVSSVVLHAGEAVINPPGVWHTTDVEGSATALFVTAGVGTEIRPR